MTNIPTFCFTSLLHPTTNQVCIRKRLCLLEQDYLVIVQVSCLCQMNEQTALIRLEKTMALTEKKRTYPYISRTEGVVGGVPVIEGSRIPVSTVICAHRLGMDFDEILVQYPNIRPEQLHAAFLYYFDHKEEIEDILNQDMLPPAEAIVVEV